MPSRPVNRKSSSNKTKQYDAPPSLGKSVKGRADLTGLPCARLISRYDSLLNCATEGLTCTRAASSILNPPCQKPDKHRYRSETTERLERSLRCNLRHRDLVNKAARDCLWQVSTKRAIIAPVVDADFDRPVSSKSVQDIPLPRPFVGNACDEVTAHKPLSRANPGVYTGCTEQSGISNHVASGVNMQGLGTLVLLAFSRKKCLCQGYVKVILVVASVAIKCTCEHHIASLPQAMQ